MHAQPGRTQVLTGRRAGARIQRRRLAGQFGAIPATKSFEEWSEDKSVLIASWHCFKGLEADAIVTIGSPVRDDARVRVNRYVARSPAKHLTVVIEAIER